MKARIGSVVLLILLFSCVATAAPVYKAEILPTGIYPFGVITNGVLPLTAYEPDCGQVASVWIVGEGLRYIGTVESEGLAINKHYLGGNSAGEYNLPFATVWKQNRRKVQLSENYSHLSALQEHIAIGDSWDGQRYCPAIWEFQGKKVNEQTFPLQGYFADINILGQIVGNGLFGEYPNDYHSSFVLQDGEIVPLLPNSFSWIFDINDFGIGCGSDTVNGINYAIKYNLAGGYERMTVPAGFNHAVATGISNDGLIVGFVSVTQNSAGYACIWQDGQCILLQDLMGETGWRLYYAYGIDNLGNIVVNGYGPMTLDRTMILTPNR